MEHEPAEYQRLQIKQLAPRTLRETAEGKYWRHFQAPVLAQHFGSVSHIDFCPVHPYNLAITASTRVIVYDGLTRQVSRTINRFKDTAYSGNWRVDGKLIVAGGQDGLVQVFDAGSRGVLRQFKAHKRPTHVAQFSQDRLHVLSGSDDVTVRWWDVITGSQVLRLDGHKDYVRCAAVSPANAETWATGAYDHVCKLWDLRSSDCLLNVDHGAPIEDVAFLPAGALMVTAGGNHLCVWDLVAGGRLVHKIASFQKTVSCVKLSPRAGPQSSAAPRLLAGSLDGHVKIFELDSFKVTHSSKYPAPVLSIGISPDCGLLAVGMADGTLSLRKHAKAQQVTQSDAVRPHRRVHYKPKLTADNYRYFIRGQSQKAAEDDYKVLARCKARLKPYDKYLRSFRYAEALDASLSTQQPEVVASVLEELATRGGLLAALSGRDSVRLLLLINYLTKYLAEPRYTKLLAAVAHRVLDLYTDMVGLSPEVDQRLEALRSRIAEELQVQHALVTLLGCLEPVLAASLSGLSVA